MLGLFSDIQNELFRINLKDCLYFIVISKTLMFRIFLSDTFQQDLHENCTFEAVQSNTGEKQQESKKLKQALRISGILKILVKARVRSLRAG